MSASTQCRESHTLSIQGTGYLSRIREFSRPGGSDLRVTIAALWGRTDNPMITDFECHVHDVLPQLLVRMLQPAIEDGRKVLVQFTLNDLYSEPYTVFNGDGGACETRVREHTRLQHLAWVRIDGKPFFTSAAHLMSRM